MHTQNNAIASRVGASTFGILAGLAGVLHGSFETLQGSVAPSGLLSAAIGPSQRFWEYGTLHALTLLPNYLTTGILAVTIGILVVIWAALFVHTKHGALILMLLSITLFLVGGGFNPIYMSLLAVLMAARINKPSNWLRRLIPNGLLSFLARLWLGCLIAFVLMFVISVEIAVLGWPLTAFFAPETVASTHLSMLAYLLFELMVLSVLTIFAHDAQGSFQQDAEAHG